MVGGEEYKDISGFSVFDARVWNSCPVKLERAGKNVQLFFEASEVLCFRTVGKNKVYQPLGSLNPTLCNVEVRYCYFLHAKGKFIFEGI